MTAPLPMYQQVKIYILKLIKEDTLAANRKLPSEHDLVKLLSVSRMTVNRALRELQKEGFVDRVSGVGTFASEPKAESHPLEIKNIAEEIVSRGHVHTCKVLALKEVRAIPEVALHFSISPGSRLLHSMILHFESGTAIQIEDRFVLPEYAPEYLNTDFTKITTNEYLINISSDIQQVEQIISAEISEKEIRTHLVIGDNEPCLLLTRKTWIKGQVVTYSHLYHPSSHYQFASKYQP